MKKYKFWPPRNKVIYHKKPPKNAGFGGGPWNLRSSGMILQGFGNLRLFLWLHRPCQFHSHRLTCYWLGGKRVDPMDPVETQRCLKLGQNVQSSNHPEKKRKNVFSSFRISYKFPMCHGQKKTSWSCGMFAQHHMAI